MKKRTLAPIVFLTLCAVVITAIAVGGSATDPLISRSYLNGTYASQVDTAVNQRLDTSDTKLSSDAKRELDQFVASIRSGSTNCAATWTETRLKAGDVLFGSTGLNVLLLAGSASVTFSSGAVVDVSTGQAVKSAAVLSANHRYLTAEDTIASFTVTSKTAVLQYQGNYAFTYSNQVDYNAIATALKTMHLFQGSFTGYGSGYDLEVAPTRLQALIMFIRVLGEESAALNYTGTTPFGDIEPGSVAAQYVGYAYAKGYTNGYTATTFLPSAPVNAYQYTEFLLRALGYSSASNQDLSDTLDRALTCGVLNEAERSMLLKNAKFLRADLVYLSYYALDATMANSSQTLRTALISKQVFTAAESAVAAQLPGPRLQ